VTSLSALPIALRTALAVGSPRGKIAAVNEPVNSIDVILISEAVHATGRVGENTSNRREDYATNFPLEQNSPLEADRITSLMEEDALRKLPLRGVMGP
jgi:hypothetical protein